MNRTYSELIRFTTFEDRFNYLKLYGKVGEETFGFERYLNQVFYKSPEWRAARSKVIIRDNACDLGIADREIFDKIIIHHLNPVTKDAILNRDPWLFDPEFLITTTKRTHDAIHFGNESLLLKNPVIRTPNDTCPWR